MRKKPHIVQNEVKVNIPSKASPRVKEAIKRIAKEDDRPFSSMVAKLLEESPRVQEKLREIGATV